MIVFAHLLNDNSGSPRVLLSVISALNKNGRDSLLFVGSGVKGCLDNAEVEVSKYWYRRSDYRILTLISYLYSQLFLFIKLIFTKKIKSDALIYVNTLLPFGAALFGKVTGRRVVYHLHEVSITPVSLQWLLMLIARYSANELIYVSDFHRKSLPIKNVNSHTIYNSLGAAFCFKAINSGYHHRQNGIFRVLMLASLRDYKGVPEFFKLAKNFEMDRSVQFELVLNEDASTVEAYGDGLEAASNVVTYSRVKDPSPFYAKASLVLNLSRPDQWIETFGLTLLESMAFGVPVIAPPIGGPAELIEDGREGFLIDSRNSKELVSKVRLLTDDEALCLQLSAAARRRSADFTPEIFEQNLRDFLKV